MAGDQVPDWLDQYRKYMVQTGIEINGTDWIKDRRKLDKIDVKKIIAEDWDDLN